MRLTEKQRFLSPKERKFLKILSGRAFSNSFPVEMENGPSVRRSKRTTKPVVKMGFVPAPKYSTTFKNASGRLYPVKFDPSLFVVSSPKKKARKVTKKPMKKATTRKGVKKETKYVSKPNFYRKQRGSRRPKLTKKEMEKEINNLANLFSRA